MRYTGKLFARSSCAASPPAAGASSAGVPNMLQSEVACDKPVAVWQEEEAEEECCSVERCCTRTAPILELWRAESSSAQPARVVIRVVLLNMLRLLVGEFELLQGLPGTGVPWSAGCLDSLTRYGRVAPEPSKVCCKSGSGSVAASAGLQRTLHHQGDLLASSCTDSTPLEGTR